jgi:hypothetical protein
VVLGGNLGVLAALDQNWGTLRRPGASSTAPVPRNGTDFFPVPQEGRVRGQSHAVRREAKENW